MDGIVGILLLLLVLVAPSALAWVIVLNGCVERNRSGTMKWAITRV
jgi:hypothetical protein